MTYVSHKSALPSHYNAESENYDYFNHAKSKITNRSVEKLLKRYKAKTVLDLACGTGEQVFWLTKRGFEVDGYDINNKMLNIAKRKAKQLKLDVVLRKGDMRTTKAGKYDAVIMIYNAIGHLTTNDFEKAIKNAGANLNDKGIYIFDIFNLRHYMIGDNIRELSTDWLFKRGKTTYRSIQYTTINEDGVMTFYLDSHVQTGSDKPKISHWSQTFQAYTVSQLKKILKKNGFKVLHQCGIDSSKLHPTKTARIITVAQKI